MHKTVYILRACGVLLMLAGTALAVLGSWPPEDLAPFLARWGEAGTISLPVVQRLAGAARFAGVAGASTGLLILLSAWLGSRQLAAAAQRLHREIQDWRNRVAEGIRLDRFYWRPLALIFLMGGYARWTYLFHPISLDEAHTFMVYASRPWYIAISDFSEYNNHVFHTLLVHLATRLGEGEAFIRIPAFAAGQLMIVLGYLLGRRFYNREAGLLTAALIAASAALVDFSTQGRGYTLFIALAMMAWMHASAILTRPGMLPWMGFAFFSMLGMYTLPVFIYPLFAGGFWLLLSAWRERGRSGLRYMIPRLFACALSVVLGTLILYMPVIMVSGWSRFANPRIRPWPMEDFLAAAPAALGHIWNYYHLFYPVWLVVALALGAVAAMCLPQCRGRHRVAFLLPLLAVSFLLFLWQRRIPAAGLGRLWLFLLPFYLASAAGGMTLLLQRILASRRVSFRYSMAALSCVVAVSLGYRVAGAGWISGWTTTPNPTYFENEAIVLYLKEHMQPEDVLMINSVAMTFQYYFYRHNVPGEISTGPFSGSGDLYVLYLPDALYTDRVEAVLGAVETNYQDRAPIGDFRHGRLFVMRRRNP